MVFKSSDRFGSCGRRRPWKWRHTTSSYANFLGTRSDIRMLTPTMRDEPPLPRGMTPGGFCDPKLTWQDLQFVK